MPKTAKIAKDKKNPKEQKATANTCTHPHRSCAKGDYRVQERTALVGFAETGDMLF